MAKRADIDSEIDALFRLPLAEFTGARNAFAARLKKEGRADDSGRVKALPKPSATAWAVNQLYWQSPKDIEQLLTVSERFRKAQAALLAGKQADLRDLMEERRDLLSNLKTRATTILAGGGHGATADAARRVAANLESLAAWGRAEGAPRAGRLTDDLAPPGFDALAALAPGGVKMEPAKILQFRTDRTRAAKEKKAAEDTAAARTRAREAVQAAGKALREARREAERAEAASKKAAARAVAADEQKLELEARYAQAREDAQTASTEARRAAQKAEHAARMLKDAEREVERARGALE